MDFQLTEEQLMIRQAARDFAQTELKPGVIERDEHQRFPAGQVKQIAVIGIFEGVRPQDAGARHHDNGPGDFGAIHDPSLLNVPKS